MKKLISYQILPANGCVAIWNTEDEDLHPNNGIALENQKRGITSIEYIFTGLCDDGTFVLCGLVDIYQQIFADISYRLEIGEDLMYKYLYRYIGDKRMVEALIRGVMDENQFSEEEAKEDILSVIKESGVECREGVIEMLSYDIQSQ